MDGLGPGRLTAPPVERQEGRTCHSLFEPRRGSAGSPTDRPSRAAPERTSPIRILGDGSRLSPGARAPGPTAREGAHGGSTRQRPAAIGPARVRHHPCRRPVAPGGREISLCLTEEGQRSHRTLPAKRIFIARLGTGSLLNQTEVERLVAARGYRTVFMEDHPVAEQLGLASRARTVVAVHGAGRAGLVMNRAPARSSICSRPRCCTTSTRSASGSASSGPSCCCRTSTSAFSPANGARSGRTRGPSFAVDPGAFKRPSRQQAVKDALRQAATLQAQRPPLPPPSRSVP